MSYRVDGIACRKIEQAMAEGKGPDLSHWKNKPLPEDSMQNVPANLRLAFRMLKNAGYIPEELALRKEIMQTEELLAAATDERDKYNQLKKLNFLKFELGCRQGRPLKIEDDSPYFSKVVDRVKGPLPSQGK